MSDIKLKIQNIVADEATKQITFDFGVDLTSVDSGNNSSVRVETVRNTVFIVTKLTVQNNLEERLHYGWH